MDKKRLAEIIAKGAHFGQTDKGGNPYIAHPMAVADLVETDDEKTLAYLHDVVEDTDVTLSDLKELGFSERIVEAVDAITKKADETRQEYLLRVKNNSLARAVKLADLEHNSDLSRLSLRPLTDRDYARREKYQKEIKFLKEE
ncbi:MAG: GTP pyrophosphokinase [Eubacterium sp.]|nr:GTP pyrophosphokinase [Eubacterium sp.]